MKGKIFILLCLLTIFSCTARKMGSGKAKFLKSISNEPQKFETNFDADEDWWTAPDMNLFRSIKSMPKWSDMEKYYPRKNHDCSNPSAEIYNSVGGTVGSIYNQHPEQNVNTCALRLSVALNKSGVPIPSKEDHTFRGKDDKFYFLSSAKLFHWALESFGKPQFTYEFQKGFEWTEELNNQIVGKKGIYIIQAKNRQLFGATGHADLFDGQECLGGDCYFNPQGGAVRVALWVLND